MRKLCQIRLTYIHSTPKTERKKVWQNLIHYNSFGYLSNINILECNSKVHWRISGKVQSFPILKLDRHDKMQPNMESRLIDGLDKLVIWLNCDENVLAHFHTISYFYYFQWSILSFDCSKCLIPCKREFFGKPGIRFCIKKIYIIINKFLFYLRIKWFNCNAAISLQEDINIGCTATGSNTHNNFSIALHDC